MQQVQAIYGYKNAIRYRDDCFNDREVDALNEENLGLVWKRLHAVTARAFDALCLSGEK